MPHYSRVPAALSNLAGMPGIVGDGTGDEDGDRFSDLAEACALMTDPCVFDPDQDSDGIPDAADNCPNDANPDPAASLASVRRLPEPADVRRDGGEAVGEGGEFGAVQLVGAKRAAGAVGQRAGGAGGGQHG